MQKENSIPVRNSLLLLLTATIWGVAFVAQSVSMDYIGGFTFNAVRNLIGALTLLPVIKVLDKTRSEAEKKCESSASGRKTLLIGGICCGIMLCLAGNFQQFGIKYTTVGKAGFITACYIIIVSLESCDFIKFQNYTETIKYISNPWHSNFIRLQNRPMRHEISNLPLESCNFSKSQNLKYLITSLLLCCIFSQNTNVPCLYLPL